MTEKQELTQRVQELENARIRHENVIEKLIDKVMKLEVANNIQNFMNEINSKDASDQTLGA